MKRMMALMALTVLTACDYAAHRDIRGERDNRQYRAAMDDYRAGRMDAAIQGFESAVRGDPANASARFQLACLQQDLKKDFVSAYCGYREFLIQHPESDRAKLAMDRMAICEKEMARTLSIRHGFNSAEGAARELAAARAEVEALKARVAAAEKNLGVSQERVRSLSAEREHLVAAVKGLDAASEEGAVAKPDVSGRDLLAEDGKSDVQFIMTEKKILEEEESDEVSTGSSLLPVRKPGDLVRRDAETPAKENVDAKTPDRPKTYVVEDGDTLYGIAKRFYGSIRPWKMIRDANKALISADNRLKAGDTIVLP